jgi:hypothetical protein
VKAIIENSIKAVEIEGLARIVEELLIFEKLMSRFMRLCHPWVYDANRNACAVGCTPRTCPRTIAPR